MILLHPLMLAGVTHMQEQIASSLHCLQADNTEDENNLLLFPRGIIQPISLSRQYTVIYSIHSLSVELWIDWIFRDDLPEGETAACRSVEESHPCGRRYWVRFTP